MEEDENITSVIPAKRTVSEMEDSSNTIDLNDNINKKQKESIPIENITNPSTEYQTSNTNASIMQTPNAKDINHPTNSQSLSRSIEKYTSQNEQSITNIDNSHENHQSSVNTKENIDNYDEDDHRPRIENRNSILQSTPFSILSIIAPCMMGCTHYTIPNSNPSLERRNEEIERKEQIISNPTIKGSRESIIQEYILSCSVYGIPNRINAGVLTTIRFCLPNLRVSSSFHDADMLALSEILLKHCNTTLKFIKRLDFSLAAKQGKLNGKAGFGSHGAFILSKILQKSEYIQELYISKHRIGPFGASAIFQSLRYNTCLTTIVMRKCNIKERGALAFCEYVCCSDVSRVREVDLSVNGIGFVVSSKIEQCIVERKRKGLHAIEVDLEGNLIFQEVMNCVTHGLGIILTLIGTYLLSKRVKDKSHSHVVSCAIYSTSLLVLYTSSTLYHSFFALDTTKYIFGILDHCAIYILIAGSYTPYLSISLHDKPIWSVYLLSFIWLLGMLGVGVEAINPKWKHKPKFSLAMYLGMGWCCMVCVPDLVAAIPQGAINLLVLGGVVYTAGVPFFVRNNNLDHSIWHCFVLAASICHWFGVYSYVAVLD